MALRDSTGLCQTGTRGPIAQRADLRPTSSPTKVDCPVAQRAVLRPTSSPTQADWLVCSASGFTARIVADRSELVGERAQRFQVRNIERQRRNTDDRHVGVGSGESG